MALSVTDIKRLVITALASDDELMETLVLKGGNAIEIFHDKHSGNLSRSSYDLDFSMEEDFDDDLEGVKQRIEKAIATTFEENGLVVFDHKFTVKPQQVRDELKDFWGGYNIEFKIIAYDQYTSLQGDIGKIRKMAIPVLPNRSPKVEIEISKYEYVGKKVEAEVDGFIIYIYSPEMIAFEKLRALCQQLQAYKDIVPSFSPRPRARDFYDIHLIMEQFGIDPSTPENKELILNIFAAKRVPPGFIQQIPEHVDIHRQDWQNVLDTLSAREKVESFDFYVGYVMEKFGALTFP